MRNQVADSIGASFVSCMVVLFCLGVVGIDGGLEGTSPWMYYLIGAATATIGSVLGASDKS